MALLDELDVLISFEIDGAEQAKKNIGEISKLIGRSSNEYKKAKKSAEQFVKAQNPNITKGQAQYQSQKLADMANVFATIKGSKLRSWKPRSENPFADIFDKMLGEWNVRLPKQFSRAKDGSYFANPQVAANASLTDNVYDTVKTVEQRQISEAEAGVETFADAVVEASKSATKQVEDAEKAYQEEQKQINASKKSIYADPFWEDLGKNPKANFNDESETSESSEKVVNAFGELASSAEETAKALSKLFSTSELEASAKTASLRRTYGDVVGDVEGDAPKTDEWLKSAKTAKDIDSLANALGRLNSVQQTALVGYANNLAKAREQAEKLKIAEQERRTKELQTAKDNQNAKSKAPTAIDAEIKAREEASKRFAKDLEGRMRQEQKERTERIKAIEAEKKSREENTAFANYEANADRIPEIAEQYNRIPEAARKAAEAVAKLKAAFGAKTEKGDLSNVENVVEELQGKSELTTEEIQKLAEALRSLSGGERNALTSYSNQMDKVASSANKASSATRNIGNAAKASGKKAHSGASGWSKFIGNVKNIIRYRIIRRILTDIGQAAKEGIQNLYQYSAALNATDATPAKTAMDSFATSALFVKNSLASVLVPVLNSIYPLVSRLASVFNAACNAVARFLAILGGKTSYTRAIQYNKEFAESADKASGSAKELQNTILGFDEINRLNDDNAGGGGAGDIADDYSKMFEETPIDEATDGIKKFIDQLKQDLQPAIERLQTSWEHLKESFDAFKNSPLGQALDDITEKLLALVGTIALDATTAVVTVFDWITEGLANVPQSTIDKISGSLEAIRTAWNGIAESDGWKNLVAVLESIVKDTILVGVTALASGLEGMATALETIEAILSGDWEGLLSKITNLFSHNGETIKEVTAVTITEVGKQLGIAEDESFERGVTIGANVTAGIMQRISPLGRAKDLFNLILDLFPKSADSEDAGKMTAEGYISGIEGEEESITTKVGDVFQRIIDSIRKNILHIGSPSKVFAEMGEFSMLGFVEGIDSHINDIMGKFDKIIDDAKEKFGLSKWLEFGRNAINGLVSGFQSIHIPTFHLDFGTSTISILGSTWNIPVPHLSFYANGGFPTAGELFVARENGMTEMVGSMGGHAAVANNQQIVEGIKEGVIEAMLSVSSRNQNNGRNEFYFYLDSKPIAARVTEIQKQQLRAAGG